ncbi:BT4734/BF3469 family protein [Pedobacter zeae]|uniref:BT4734-like N-terminal domain-containing protein n=1 Tax=Pedobacter zeae TaxID=1737356 RepID=A0A7W6P588_9SPHI|nr:BT4734/BF3469 family protein [Pedobacter zeae]MBB4108349.1 hypothetical protein [Pedobacter zeae]GGG93379.1 hypothetical protein GCM10007422_03240 [Pedobacter zeae]
MSRPFNEKCSLYKTYYSKKLGRYCFSVKDPETVSIYDMLSFPWQGNLENEVRAIENKDKRDTLKKRLKGITPSMVHAGGRGAKYCVEHNGLMAFDIDPKDTENPWLKKPGMLEEAKKMICEIPYTVYCGLSASGRGLWGLFRISHPHLHKQHFDAMEAAFLEIGIVIDKAPSSPSSLRFLAYDENAYYNEHAELFDKRIVPEPKKVEPLIKKRERINGIKVTNEETDEEKKQRQEDAIALCEKFNKECKPDHIDEILTNFGFNYHSHSGLRYRYTRPNKEVTAGLSVDYHEGKRTLFCFSDAVPGLEHWKEEEGGWSCSPLTALLIYGCGGKTAKDWAMAFEYIKSKIQ